MKIIILLLSIITTICFAQTAIPTPNPSMILMTDLHFSYTLAGSQSGQGGLINSILSIKPLPNAIILAGDSTSRGADSRDWVKYNETMSKIPSTIPVYSTIGNHETYDYSATTSNYMKPGYVKGFANFKKQFNLTSLYYSKDVGNTHLIFLEVIDNNWNITTTRDGTAGQYAWLVNDLNTPSAQKAKFIIIITHMPMAPNNGFGTYLWSDGAYKSYNKIAQLVKDKKVSLFIGGHTHSYKKLYNADNKAWYMIAGGPGAEGYMKMTEQGDILKIEKIHSGKLIDTILINARSL